MPEPRPTPDPVEDGWKFPGWLTGLIAVAVVVCVVLAFVVPPSSPEPTADDQQPAPNRAQEAVADIESAMEEYANAHGGRYPTGQSSTEVFQKLLDEHFVKDPRLFYLEMTGKTAATSSLLTAANVSFDVTVPIDLASSSYIPVVFSTGCRIEYKPGGRAVPLAGHPLPDLCAPGGILMAFPGHKIFFTAGSEKSQGATVIPAQAQIGQGPYTQLTPDGPLPPP